MYKYEHALHGLPESSFERTSLYGKQLSHHCCYLQTDIFYKKGVETSPINPQQFHVLMKSSNIPVPPLYELVHTLCSVLIAELGIFKVVNNEIVKGWIMEASVL